MIGIYVIENECNHKRYIGKTIDYTRRVYLHTHYLMSHRHVNSHLQSAWDKYGSSNFKFYMLYDITDWSKGKTRSEIDERLNDLEKGFIRQYRAFDDRYGYNLSAGGDGATLFGDRNPSYGKTKSSDVRKKISNTIRKNNSHSGKNNGRYGKPVSESTKQKISVANKGRVQSDEEKARRKVAMQIAVNNPINIAKREQRKNDPKIKERHREIGLKRRKYTDEFITNVRSEYSSDADIPILAERYNMPIKTCMEMVHKNGHFCNR